MPNCFPRSAAKESKHDGHQQKVYLAVNFNSSHILIENIRSWRALDPDIKVYCVDNFSSEGERCRVLKLAKTERFYVIENENNGYGDALNKGLRAIKLAEPADSDAVIFFGNSDVTPLFIDEYVEPGSVPELNIYGKHSKNHNPFLTAMQMRSIWILWIAARLRSRTVKLFWSAISRLLAVLPSNTAALHGSLYAMNIRTLRQLPELFTSEIFLYQEELLFAEVLKLHGVRIRKSQMRFRHEGSVSTSKTVKLDRDYYFSLWCDSTISFFLARSKLRRAKKLERRQPDTYHVFMCPRNVVSHKIHEEANVTLETAVMPPPDILLSMLLRNAQSIIFDHRRSKVRSYRILVNDIRVGFISLQETNSHRMQAAKGAEHPELTIRIAEPYRGRGIAREALTVLSLSEPNYYALVRSENAASIALFGSISRSDPIKVRRTGWIFRRFIEIPTGAR